MHNLDAVFEALAKPAFRRRFVLGVREGRYLRERGMETVIAQAHELIAKRLAPERPVNDGKQTPFRGHPVFIAQHATATCCRACLSKWHGIAPNKALDDAERQHVVDAIARWLNAQPLADLSKQENRQRELPF
ncbi:hypothetical protein BHUM_03794 [Candidatus Burkholderia humilis]|nr:hypothetical protein BHUM_03794 [Candidatus Burkholderia humilis]